MPIPVSMGGGRWVGSGEGRDTGENGRIYWVAFVASRYLFLHLRAGLEEDGAGLEEGGAGQPPHFSSFIPGSESELQIALIALFSEMLYRFPNMVVAQVTRESVQQAIASGITAQQVSLRELEIWRGAVLVLGAGQGIPVTEAQPQVCQGRWQSPGYREVMKQGSLPLNLSNSTVDGCLIFASLTLLPVNSSSPMGCWKTRC